MRHIDKGELRFTSKFHLNFEVNFIIMAHRYSSRMIFNSGKISYRQQTSALDIFLLQNPTLLDVRTVHEFVQTKIAGAQHVALENIADQIDFIKSWNTPVVTYCNDGTRSRMATLLLKRANIKVVDGGGKEELVKLLMKKETTNSF